MRQQPHNVTNTKEKVFNFPCTKEEDKKIKREKSNNYFKN